VRIEGIVCSHSDNYRQVGGGRIVTDVMLANNRICHRGNDYIRKSSYLPSIVWGNDAKAMVKHVNVGDEIRVEGRFQSRTYHRKNDDLDEVHVAYELSLKEFDVINKHNDDNKKKVI
jgi:single-stranded DNA-binding protein